MAQSLSFPSTSVNLELPLLFAGQAQKEFVLNHALAALDSFATGVVKDVRSEPAGDEKNGQCFLVSGQATGSWIDRHDNIALRVGDGWHFVAPQDGMTVFDQERQLRLVYNSGWLAPASLALPAGGTVVDIAARAANTQLVEILRDVSVLPPSIA